MENRGPGMGGINVVSVILKVVFGELSSFLGELNVVLGGVL